MGWGARHGNRRRTGQGGLGIGSANGQHYKTVVIVMPKDGGGSTITLKDVVIGAFSSHGDVHTWTASFADYEMGTSPPPAP